MSAYNHLFFDLDKTIAPSRQPMLAEMQALLSQATQTIVIVSGQDIDAIAWQSNGLKAYYLGQNGNRALDPSGKALWDFELTKQQKVAILQHIEALTEQFSLRPKPEHRPIEDRGGQITFSPVGNTAPVEIKSVYDPDASKRLAMLEAVPFVSKDLVVKIGGSTSFDYIHKDHHKGTNVARLIELKRWNKNECIYYGDGLYPGGNDEAVIGVIETVPVSDHNDTFKKLQALL